MLAAIVAKAKNNVIGKENKLIWHLPEDLKFFKEKTTGHIIIMGRKTFESLPFILPKREHWVITNQKDYLKDNDQVKVFHSVQEVMAELRKVEKENLAKDANLDSAFIIGGAQIYKAFLPHIDRLYCTEINADIEGDTYFPVLPASFKKVAESEVKTTEKYPWTYTFVTYEQEKGC